MGNANQRRMGVVMPHIPLAELPELARGIAALGYTDLWAGESDRYEASVPLAIATASAPELRIGTAVLPVQTRGRYVLAQTAATLDRASGGNFVLGVGASSPFIVSRWNGLPYDPPLASVRNTVAYLRRRFDELKQSIPIYIGALGPKMAALASEAGDGVVLTCLAASDVPRVRTGGAGEVVAWVSVCVVDDERDLAQALGIGRRRLTPYLMTPAYAAFHRRLGRTIEPLDDAALRELFIAGPADYCRAELARFHDEGVDTVLVELTPGFGDIRRDLRALAPAGQ